MRQFGAVFLQPDWMAEANYVCFHLDNGFVFVFPSSTHTLFSAPKNTSSVGLFGASFL